jgi:competence protein ComEC
VSTKIPFFISIALVATGLIVVRYQFTRTEKVEGSVVLQGTVIEEPRQKGQSSYFDFEGYRIRTLLYPKISYGDVIKVEGEANEDGLVAFPKIEQIGRESNFQTGLFTTRGKIEEKINKFLPEPQSSLLTGVLLGVEKGLPSDFEEALRETGTIHVVVVSGYNIGVVGGFFLLLAGWIKRKYAITLSLFAIVFYTFLTGAQAPTVRAAIMGGLAFSATIVGRQNLPLYSLMLAAFFMLMINPNIISDIGFQLSFLATAGIILFKDPLFGYLRSLPSPFGEDLTTTLSAQALVIPIIFFHFGQVSIISPIVNALVLWTIPLSTILGFSIAFFGFVFEPIGQLLAWVAWVPLSVFIWVVQGAANLPLSLVQVPEKNLGVLVGYYLSLSVVVFLLLKYVRIYKNKSA